MISALLQRVRRRKARRRSEDGFTLVELLVVLGILTLLIGIATPQVIKFLAGAKTDTARLDVDRLSGVLDLYRLEVGDYPGDDAGIEALVERPPGAERWNGPYVKKADSVIDPWGRPYRYRYPGEHGVFDLYSLGRDNQEGGEGEDQDITNW